MTFSLAATIGGFVGVVMLGAFATSAGVGGGALYIPLFVFVFYPDEGLAVPLAKASVFGAAIAMFLFNAKRTRHSGRGPLIDCMFWIEMNF